MSDARGEPRSIDDRLVLGLIFAPIICVWALLRPEHSRTVRVGAAVYIVLVGVIAATKLL